MDNSLQLCPNHSQTKNKFPKLITPSDLQTKNNPLLSSFVKSTIAHCYLILESHSSLSIKYASPRRRFHISDCLQIPLPSSRTASMAGIKRTSMVLIYGFVFQLACCLICQYLCLFGLVPLPSGMYAIYIAREIPHFFFIFILCLWFEWFWYWLWFCLGFY